MQTHPNAKINIGLNVVSKREDGYHNLETIFYPVSLCDKLELKTTKRKKNIFKQKGIEIEGEYIDNLVFKAYKLLAIDYTLPPVNITLTKNIPFGAGLGGGSSDAAFMLKMLNYFFNLKIETEQLEKYASKLGADCAFFIKNKPVFASGIGDVFQETNLSLKDYYIVLIKPDIFVSTPDAFCFVKPHKPEFSLLDISLIDINEWKHLIVNDFEKSVFRKYPEIAEIKDYLYNSGAVYASMSGSGSTVYGIFKEMPILTEAEKYGQVFITKA